MPGRRGPAAGPPLPDPAVSCRPRGGGAGRVGRGRSLSALLAVRAPGQGACPQGAPVRASQRPPSPPSVESLTGGEGRRGRGLPHDASPQPRGLPASTRPGPGPVFAPPTPARRCGGGHVVVESPPRAVAVPAPSAWPRFQAPDRLSGSSARSRAAVFSPLPSHVRWAPRGVKNSTEENFPNPGTPR